MTNDKGDTMTSQNLPKWRAEPSSLTSWRWPEMVATVKARARHLTEAWLRGATQGGHIVTPEDIAAVHRASMWRARQEVGDDG
jgi:hypothetical protein